MNHSQKLQAIRDKIIEAVPEIMELKFGCCVVIRSDQVMVLEISENHPYTVSGFFLQPRMGVFKSYDLEKKEIKIIGRTILLSDVLVAIDKATRGTSYFVDAQGCFHEWFAPQGRLDLRTVAKLNLRDDDLDNASEECVAFLYELFYGKV